MRAAGLRPAIAASRTRFFPDERQVGTTSRGACSGWGAAPSTQHLPLLNTAVLQSYENRSQFSFSGGALAAFMQAVVRDSQRALHRCISGVTILRGVISSSFCLFWALMEAVEARSNPSAANISKAVERRFAQKSFGGSFETSFFRCTGRNPVASPVTNQRALIE